MIEQIERDSGKYPASKLLEEGRKLLRDAGIDNDRQEALMFLSEACGKPELTWLQTERFVSAEEKNRFEAFLKRRIAGEPVQYILGYAWFYGYRFHVSPDVLIPRFDTENLVEAALKRAEEIEAEDKEVPDKMVPGKEGLRVLDLCTGSGAIGLSFAAERAKKGKSTLLDLLDISPDALRMARKNAEEIYPEARLYQSDLFAAMDPDSTYDMILSNPPYVTAEEMEELPIDVKDHEPHLALFGGSDGLDFYRKITMEAGNYLKPGGYLIFEIGCHQAEEVKNLLETNGYSKVEVIRDLSGLDRVVSACK